MFCVYRIIISAATLISHILQKRALLSVENAVSPNAQTYKKDDKHQTLLLFLHFFKINQYDVFTGKMFYT